MTNSNSIDPIQRSQSTIDTIEQLSKMGWSALQEPTPEEIKEYKAHLETRPEEEIHDTFLWRISLKMQRTKEEWVDHLLQSANLEYEEMDYNCKMPRWSPEEGVAMLLEKKLWKLECHNIKRHSCDSPVPFIQKHNKLLKLVRESIKYGELQEYFTPMEFVIWARRKDIDLPARLVELVTKYASANDTDWEAKYKELAIEHNSLKQKLAVKQEEEKERLEKEKEAKPLNTRREESYQKLIAILARLKYPNKESINACNIANQAASLDLPFSSISEDTIRTLLEPVRQMLGIKQSAQNKINAIFKDS